MKTKKLHTAVVAFVCMVAFVTKISGNTYYYKTTATSNPTIAANWTTSSTGIGGTSASLPTFTNTAHTLNLFNTTAGVSATLTGNWTNLNSGTVLNVGNTVGVLTSTLDFSTFTFNRSCSVRAVGTVKSSVSNPTFLGSGQFVYNSASTTTLSNNAVTVSSAGFSAGYGNLNLTGTSATLGGYVIVNGVLVANAIVMNGQQLDLNSTVTSLGTITGDASAILNFATTGSVALSMSQTTPGTTNLMNTITFNGAGTLTLSNGLVITPGGVITPLSGTLDVGTALLTLSASKGLSGAIGDCSGGTLAGTSIISQVYHNPTGNSTNWTTLGVAGVTNSIFQQWRSGFAITCASCIDGCCPGGVTFTSITSYDETATGGGDYTNAAHYIDLPNDANTINNGQGYWVYMGNTSPGTASAAESISVTGAPQQGNVPLGFTFTNGTNGYNLLANPYPCPISWSTLMTNTGNGGGQMTGDCYIYNALDGSYGQMDAAGLLNGTSSYGLVDDVISTGMAFYITATANGTLTFDETVKSPRASQDLQRVASINQTQSSNTQIPRFSLQATGINMKGQTMFAFDSRASLGRDYIIDAAFLPGTEPLKVTSLLLGMDMAINGMPNLNQNYSIPVKMTIAAGNSGTYSINGVNFKNMPIGTCLVLHDNYTSANYDLRQGPYNITLTDTENVARFVLNITVAPLAITTNSTQASCSTANDGFITAVGNNAGPWNYTWKNANNVVVKTSTNKAGADTLGGLNSGAYKVDVNTVGTCDDAIQSFTITAPALPTSAFTITSSTVIVSTVVTFTNNSTNATSFWWTFGDGGTSNQQNPNYTYNMTGTDTVTLYAFNAACNDTVISQQIITVNATTGISAYASQEIIVNKDQNGAFVKFNFAGQTKVNINVYNSLGQVLLSNANLAVVNDKIYLNVDNAKDQLIFISIANLDKNTQVTKKLFNN